MSSATYLILVVALVLGAAFRDEVIHLSAIAGVGVALVGAWVAARPVKSPDQERPDTAA
jgi:drug/metabolite transporter (DMT)-like permease